MESTYYPQMPSAFDGGRRRQQTQYLHQLAERIEDAAGVDVTTQYLERRETVDGLCEAATQGVDLVVLATHGYSWFERLWHGSIVHDLIDQLAPPMLVLRGDGLRAAIAPDRWLRRMLVPLDGSLHAEAALDAAAALGRLYDARYSLLTVTPTHGWDDRDIMACGPDGTVRTQPAARHYLRRMLRQMRRQSLPTHTCLAVSDESVAEAIVSRAGTSRADCIAMVPSRRGGLRRWWDPGVTRQVLRQAQTPVLIVPGGNQESIN